ncbi:MAG: hypothetical protein ABR616_01725 [Dermatophilaceae bacterium]
MIVGLQEAKRVAIVVVLVAIGFLLASGVMGMLGGGVLGFAAAWLLYRAIRRGAFRPALNRLAQGLDGR